jgi:hypothetical protein
LETGVSLFTIWKQKKGPQGPFRVRCGCHYDCFVNHTTRFTISSDVMSLENVA